MRQFESFFVAHRDKFLLRVATHSYNIVSVCDILQDCVTCFAKFCDSFQHFLAAFSSADYNSGFSNFSVTIQIIPARWPTDAAQHCLFSMTMIKLMSSEQAGLCMV